MRHLISPAETWERFRHTESLLVLVHASLPMEGSGGHWRYYNFTSTSSLWDADLQRRNSLSIDFRDAASTRIAQVAVELTATEHPCHAQLLALLERLATEYSITRR